jgi:CubicO group peptidase (beta-lactamase class C family)
MRVRVRLWLEICGIACSVGLHAQDVTATIPRMKEVIASYTENQSYMGAVLVAQNGQLLLNQGYGDADLEWGVRNGPETRFRIGSITKQFTAACTLLLEERGKVNLSAPITTYLPDAPSAWRGVTVYNLLTHTSGIPNLTSGSNWDTFRRKSHTPDESIAEVSGKALEFVPGEKFSYSNSNYIILGRMIEKISGLSYEEFLQQNVLTPLGLLSTGVDHDEAILPRRARGYERGPHGLTHAPFTSMTIPYAAGFLYSTTGDLLRWEESLYGGKLLSPTSLKKMTTPFKGDYAMGLNVLDAKRHGVITHNGSIDGFDDSLNYYPDRHLAVIVLSNVRTAVPDKMAEQLGKVAYGESVVVTADHKQVGVPAKLLAEYVGKYSSSSFGLTISVEGDHLLSTTPSGQTVALYPESQTHFFIKEFDGELEFVRDPQTNKIVHMRVLQNGTERIVPMISH